MPKAYVAQLMRRRKSTGAVDVMAETICADFGTGWRGYQYLWHWIGGRFGHPHPHPDCLYWIQARAVPALRPTREEG
jgi:hypothetical protein